MEGALPQEQAEIEILTRKKKFARARAIKVLKASDQRVKPDCKYFESCGGCQFWHVSYQDELKIKVDAAVHTIEKIAKLKIPQFEVHEAPSTSAWRNRATLQISQGKVGFFQRSSHEVVDIEECPILMPELNSALKSVRSATPPKATGQVVLETAGNNTALISTSDFSLPNLPVGFPVAGVHDKSSRRGMERIAPDVAFPALESHSNGLGQIGLESGQFRQSNDQVNRALVAHVKSLFETRSEPHLFEYFAGAGNFTWAIADRFRDVDAYEGGKEAVDLGNAIAKGLRRPNVRFHAQDLFQMAPPAFGQSAVLLDPPRDGGQKVCQMLVKKSPKFVVYVSCDPATLARDLGILSSKYQIRTFNFFDMFPRSGHIETVVSLELI